RNSKYPIDTLTAYFNGDRCPTLIGKPKIFIIQACRGEKPDSGVKLKALGPDVADNSGPAYRIPSIADFIIYYCTAPGHYAFRNVEIGSYFIQSLASVLNEYCYNNVNMDLMTLLTFVNLQVAYASLTYDMKHRKRGKCLVFNHEFFDPHTGRNPRRGTARDAEAIVASFQRLEFDVELKTDASYADIRHAMSKVSTDDHTDNDCVAVVACRGNLSASPKACRKPDSGVKLKALGPDVADNSGPVYRIPSIADFIIYYCTAPGHYAFRNTQYGSYFIQALASVLNEYCYNNTNIDLMTLLTFVNLQVAYGFQSNAPNKSDYHKKKQIPAQVDPQ
ncbi:unnamed protein product, partial [Oppiella nova]